MTGAGLDPNRRGRCQMLPFAEPGIVDLVTYVGCLVDAPYGCRYALSYGHRYFCLNPEREGIVARTEAKQRE